MTGQVIALTAAVLFYVVTRPTFVGRLAAVIVLIWLVCEGDWDTARYAWRKGTFWRSGE